MRQSTDTGDYHTGRGGAGNEHMGSGHAHHGHHHDEKSKAEAVAGADDKDQAPVSLADKLKQKLFGAFK